MRQQEHLDTNGPWLNNNMRCFEIKKRDEN